MKKAEIENRVEEIKDGKMNFFMVDLVIGDEKIGTGDNPISSHSFWEKMQDATQRALYRIERDNPKMNFDHNFRTMGMSDEQKEIGFKSHIQEKYPKLDVDMVFDIIDKEVSKIETTGPDDNHPNPFMKAPVGGHLSRAVMVSVIDKILNKENE